MKLYPYFFFICILFSFSSNAQFTSGGISAQGGPGYVSYHATGFSNVSTSNQAMFSFQSGVFATYSLTKKSGLEAELNYLLQQGEFKNYISNLYVGSTIGEGTDVFTTKLGYLTLPIRYTYSIHHFTLMGGIQTGILLHGRSFEDGSASSSDTTYYWSTESPVDYLKTIDFGITLGGQENISDRLFVSLTIFHSLFNMFPDNPVGASQRNTNVLAGIGYRLFTPKSKGS